MSNKVKFVSIYQFPDGLFMASVTRTLTPKKPRSYHPLSKSSLHRLNMTLARSISSLDVFAHLEPFISVCFARKAS